MTKKPDKRDEIITELTADLQRVQADFENYRKNVDIQKAQARQIGEEAAVIKLLPVIDNIERAAAHIPAELTNNDWVRGVVGLAKNLEIITNELGLSKINAAPGTPFNLDLHEAVQFDDNAVGDTEVVEAELQPGYTYNGTPIRHSMVRVTRQ